MGLKSVRRPKKVGVIGGAFTRRAKNSQVSYGLNHLNKAGDGQGQIGPFLKKE